MKSTRSGNRNLITDVEGLRVGNAEDGKIKTGVTAVIFDEPATASVQVLGGAPGTRETDLLEPDKLVPGVDALVLSGGSAFGLDAASGVQEVLKAQRRGFAVGAHTIPIVPAAILFDLLNGGDKNWTANPYSALGAKAASSATLDFEIGSVGAGKGALTATLKGGLGSASTVMEKYGVTIGAIVAVNALGATNIGETKHFWAAPFEVDAEFGGLGMPQPFPENASDLRIKMRDQQNTTIAILATNATLTKAQCKRLAVAAHGGFARAIWPSHTPLDGDLIFAASTNKRSAVDEVDFAIDLSAVAASTMARAIARGVYSATAETGDTVPVWSGNR
ncbi:MAG: P1 family peptidase [Pseudomonadota bacterium]